MPATVRVPPEAHARLVRLQDSWQRRRGDRPAQAELVERALEYAERNLEAFIDEVGWRPWTAEEIERFFRALPTFEGPIDLSEDIDSWVYGSPTDPGDPA